MSLEKRPLQLAEWVNGLMETGDINTEICSHMDQVQNVIPSADGCEECLQLGDDWVYLRLCMICGHVGCCDNSKNKHATKHYHSTDHPLIKSFEPGENWIWCYPDQELFTP